MRTVIPIAVRTILLLLLLSSSGAVLYITYRNARNAGVLADLSLESTALALSASAESALRAGGAGASGEIREILSDRVVAYALIAGKMERKGNTYGPGDGTGNADRPLDGSGYGEPSQK